MNKKLKIIIFYSILIFSSEPIYSNNWITTTFINNKYSIEFPNKPAVNVLNKDNNVKELEKCIIQYFTNQSENDDNIQYAIVYSKLPNIIKGSDQNKDVFVTYKTSINQMIEMFGGSLIYEKEIIIDKNIGIQIGVEIPKRKTILTARFLRIDNFQFIIFVITRNEQINNELINKFITSFRKNI